MAVTEPPARLADAAGHWRGARLGIIDDHAAMRIGVAALFAQTPDIRVVAGASGARALLNATDDLDLVLLDLRLADGSTPNQNVRLLASVRIGALAYTSGDDPALVREAARAAVVGMIRKSEPAEVLVEAVRTALRGEVVASTDWAAALDGDSAIPEAGLTSRESQVLELYASGEKADRVAHILGISRETVLDHVRKIRAKYASVDRPAKTKVDLFRRAIEDGIIGPPS
ncbi:DNA-binding NarL/FixJ family response regulator [Cellulosimicrobium cellulans]|nr:DNA-binding NarL/FixJ family response regulator [Cellulosimicrobium cellulans]